MPIQYATSSDVERDTANLGMAVQDEIVLMHAAERGDAGGAFVFIGALIYWARKLATFGRSAIVIYNPLDLDADGPDIPHGFEVNNEQ